MAQFNLASPGVTAQLVRETEDMGVQTTDDLPATQQKRSPTAEEEIAKKEAEREAERIKGLIRNAEGRQEEVACLIAVE